LIGKPVQLCDSFTQERGSGDNKKTKWEISVNEVLLLLAGGLLAGTLGGLLGLGGGIVLMPLLRFGANLPPAHAAATCILAVFFTTLGGSYRYQRRGLIQIKPIVPVIIAGAVVTVVASLAFRQLAIHDRWLDLGIGLVFSLISLRMLLEGVPRLLRPRAGATSTSGIQGSLKTKVGIGAAAGVLPGLLGIGTGGVLVPALTYLLRAPIKAAIVASLVCFCLNAFISCIIKLAQGFIDLERALPVCLGTLFGANLGALLNGRFPSRALKLIFGLVFSFVALKFISSFLGKGV
jgi:uncharacterized membrane protein YfcA